MIWLGMLEDARELAREVAALADEPLRAPRAHGDRDVQNQRGDAVRHVVDDVRDRDRLDRAEEGADFFFPGRGGHAGAPSKRVASAIERLAGGRGVDF